MTVRVTWMVSAKANFSLLLSLFSAFYGNPTPHTERFIHYRKYILQITQPSQYRCTQLQYMFAVISEAPSMYIKCL